MRRRWQILLVSVFTICLGLIASPNLFGYTYWTWLGTPWHWANASATMDLQPISFPQNNSYTNRMLDALGVWGDVLGSPFEFSHTFTSRNINNHNDSHNAVAWVSSGCDDYRGITFMRKEALTAHMKGADIFFDVDCDPWVPSSPGLEENVHAPKMSFLWVAEHELGHALALDHNFDSIAAMNYFNHFERLRGDDKTGLRFLYPASGTDVDLSVSTSVDRVPGDSWPMDWVSTYPSNATVGDSIDIEYAIENHGNAAVSSVAVGFYFGNNLAAESWFNLPVHSIGTFTRTIPVPNIPPGSYDISIEIDHLNQVVEHDESNNRLKLPWGRITVEAAPPSPPEAPLFDPPSGIYPSPLTIVMTSTTPGTTIHYSIAEYGSIPPAPTCAWNTSGPSPLATTWYVPLTFAAIACKDGVASEVTIAEYQSGPPPPCGALYEECCSTAPACNEGLTCGSQNICEITPISQIFMFNAGTIDGAGGGSSPRATLDALCQNNKPGLCPSGPGHEVMAFISVDADDSVRNAFGSTPLPKTIPITGTDNGTNSTVIAANWNQLVGTSTSLSSCQLENSLEEASVVPSDSYHWIGYNIDLDPGFYSYETCNAWSSTTVGGNAGYSGSTDCHAWTSIGSLCAVERSLLCVCW